MGGRALTTGRREGDEIEYIARSSESHCQSHCQAHLQLIVSMRPGAEGTLSETWHLSCSWQMEGGCPGSIM